MAKTELVKAHVHPHKKQEIRTVAKKAGYNKLADFLLDAIEEKVKRTQKQAEEPFHIQKLRSEFRTEMAEVKALLQQQGGHRLGSLVFHMDEQTNSALDEARMMEAIKRASERRLARDE